MEQRKNWIVGTGLFLATMILYWPATRFPFVCYDDQLLVYANPHVSQGLTWAGIRWAATAVVAACWYPLTLWSHMLDCSLYGLFAGGHHLTNILLHSTNVVLLWLLVKRMTGLFWPGALVAALFAWHPLNVESATWIAERKNVLSGLFFMLTLWAYFRHVEHPGPARYTLALTFFALALAAKPMVVTLPFLLLLLDYWPLRRISPVEPPDEAFRQRQIWPLLLEKIPFMVLSLASCLITVIVENSAGAVKSTADVPMELRLLDMPVAYVTYVTKMLWPARLCVFYDFPGKPPVAAAAASLLLLAAMTFAAWRWRSKFRWLLVGWLWFLGAMVPVIGLVQSGYHSMADRNTYLPLIGLFLIIACGLNEFWAAKPALRNGIVAAAVVFLGINLMLARRQIMFWKDSVALFTQAVAVNPESAPAHELLAVALTAGGRQADALVHYAAAVRLRPNSADFQYELARTLIDAGRFTEADNCLQAALKQTPDNPVLHNTRGVALMMSGRSKKSQSEFARAIELQPDYSKPYFNLGKALLAAGQIPAAITNFTTALKLQPDWIEASEILASAYAAAGNLSNAVATSSMALKMAQAGQQPDAADRIAAELKAYQKAASLQSSSPQKN
jgi:tetratricopeptide (TPR) repeat protein